MDQTTQNFANVIIDSIADPVLVITPDYRVLQQNEAAKRFCKGRTISPEAEHCYKIISGRETPCAAADEFCPVGEVFASGKEVKTVREFHDSAGNKKYYEISATPLFENDRVIGAVEVFRDITALKMTEKLINSKNELLREYEILHKTFTQVEIAKKEWELTMD